VPGLYESEGEEAGTVAFFDVEDEPPERGLPMKTLAFREVLKRIEKTYRDRNRRQRFVVPAFPSSGRRAANHDAHSLISSTLHL
jgi:hypothetical protein